MPLTTHLCAMLDQSNFKTKISSSLNSVSFIAPVYVGNGASLNHVFLGSYSSIGNKSNIVNTIVNNYSTIGNNFRSGLGRHALNEFSTSASFYQSNHMIGYPCERENSIHKKYNSYFCQAIIASDVLIKDNVLFTNDISVDAGAVIEKGSVITKNIEPYTIVSGTNNVIGQRFSDEIIADLLEARWWQYDIPQMINQGINVPMQDPRALIQFLKDQDP